MTLFLTVIDRTVTEGATTFEVAARIRDLLTKTSESYQRFIGRDYEREPKTLAATKRQHVHVLSWTRYRSGPPLASNNNYWAMSAGHHVGPRLIECVRPQGGSLVYSQPVWGQYAAVFGLADSAQVYAWNTTPALESVHWSAIEEYVVISNRPLLAALYLAHAKGLKAPELSPDYVPEYLYYGYSITGQTPFKDVRTLSVNSALAVSNGRVSLRSIPSGLHSSLGYEHTLEEGADALASALTNAMDRTEQEINDRPLQLRLSGGKDSRLLLGLLRNRQLDYRVVTYGQESDVDVQLASHLCEMVGIDGEVRFPRPADGETIATRITTTLRESGGMPPSEPHTAQYRGADPEKPNEAIMLGQWPLYKGGMAHNLGASSHTVRRRLCEQGAAFVHPSIAQVFDQHLLAWAEQSALSEDIEKLYLFAREFRSGRYLHAHVEHYSRSSMLAYPIADAEVTAVCDALTMEEKVSERALFGALYRIWPEVMKVPLDRSQWKFERNQKDPELSGPLYEERRRPIPSTRPRNPIQSRMVVVSEYSDAAAIELATHLMHSEHYVELSSYLSEDMKDAVAKTSSGEIVPPPAMSRKMFIKHLWRLAVADRWLSREWFV